MVSTVVAAPRARKSAASVHACGGEKLLDAAQDNPQQSQLFNWDRVNQFRGFGGVRIEDNVLITDKGVENLTFVPRTVKEIEDFMESGANFK